MKPRWKLIGLPSALGGSSTGDPGTLDAPTGAASTLTASGARSRRSSGVRESSAMAAIPTMPATAEATCGAPSTARAHMVAAMAAPAIRIIGAPRLTAPRPPWMCATTSPLTMISSAKSTAMWGPMISPGIPVTSWMV